MIEEKKYPISMKAVSILASIEVFLRILIQFLSREKCCAEAIL